MENSIYLYSKDKVVVERLHICTWDFKDGTKTKVELGFEIDNTQPSDSDKLRLSVHLPFEVESSQIKSLHETLCNEKYSRYIFNDVIASSDMIGGDAKRGKLLHFKERGCLSIIPANFTVNSEDASQIDFIIDTKNIDANVYIRVLIATDLTTIAETRSGITKKSFIFDLKVNERRNIPDDLIMKVNADEFVDIKNVFVFHVTPDDYDLDFYDSNRFKSLRMLEKDIFAGYTGIKELQEDDFVIIFLKQSRNTSYSFYTTFSYEIIGNNQILLAIGTNIICSFLFALPSFRSNLSTEKAWYAQIPCEWWISLAILMLVGFSILRRK